MNKIVFSSFGALLLFALIIWGLGFVDGFMGFVRAVYVMLMCWIGTYFVLRITHVVLRKVGVF